jgi:hypothetical protein
MTKEQAALDLYLTYETQHADHFTAQLFRLIAKGDGSRRRLLARGFPMEVEAYEEWMLTPTTQEFYDKYDVKKHYVPVPRHGG